MRQNEPRLYFQIETTTPFSTQKPIEVKLEALMTEKGRTAFNELVEAQRTSKEPQNGKEEDVKKDLRDYSRLNPNAFPFESGLDSRLKDIQKNGTLLNDDIKRMKELDKNYPGTYLQWLKHLEEDDAKLKRRDNKRLEDEQTIAYLRRMNATQAETIAKKNSIIANMDKNYQELLESYLRIRSLVNPYFILQNQDLRFEITEQKIKDLIAERDAFEGSIRSNYLCCNCKDDSEDAIQNEWRCNSCGCTKLGCSC